MPGRTQFRSKAVLPRWFTSSANIDQLLANVWSVDWCACCMFFLNNKPFSEKCTMRIVIWHRITPKSWTFCYVSYNVCVKIKPFYYKPENVNFHLFTCYVYLNFRVGKHRKYRCVHRWKIIAYTLLKKINNFLTETKSSHMEKDDCPVPHHTFVT